MPAIHLQHLPREQAAASGLLSTRDLDARRTATPGQGRVYAWRDPARVTGLPEQTASTAWRPPLDDRAS